MAAYDLPKRLLHWFAVISTISVLGLICSGGLVTSHDAGMAVPGLADSFGYKNFFFSISPWGGGVFFRNTPLLVSSLGGVIYIGSCDAALVISGRRRGKRLA